MNPTISHSRKTFLLNPNTAYYFGLADPESVKNLWWKKLIKVNLLADSGGAPVSQRSAIRNITMLHGHYLWQRIPPNFDIEFPEIWRIYPNWGFRPSPDEERKRPSDTEQIYVIERLQYVYEGVRLDRRRRNERSHIKVDTSVLRLLALHESLTDWQIAKHLKKHIRVICASVTRLALLDLLFLNFQPAKGSRRASLRYRDDGKFYYFRMPERLTHLRRWNLEGRERWQGYPARFAVASCVEEQGGHHCYSVQEDEIDLAVWIPMPKHEATKQLCMAIRNADLDRRYYESAVDADPPQLYSKNGLYKLTNFWRPKLERAIAEAIELGILELIDGKYRHSLYKPALNRVNVENLVCSKY